METEVQYLKDMKNGSHAAFDWFYLRYSSRLEDFSFLILKDRAAAKDICQNVFLRFWSHRASADRIRSVSSYLFTMTRNAVLDLLRKRRISLSDVMDELDCALAPSADLQEQMIASDKLDRIEDALSRIPEKRARIFRMNRFEGIDNKEIATKEGITMRAVEWNIRKTLDELDSYLT